MRPTTSDRPGPVTSVLVVMLFWAVVAAIAVLHAQQSAARPHSVVGVHPDPRVVWQRYPVGGLGLCRANPDTCVVLPSGSVLWVPSTRDGTGSEQEKPN